jgi:hypothetical protein
MREPYVTVVESTAFARQASAIWSEAEYETFVTFIAANPEAGEFVPETGGVRKVRWRRPGSRKRGRNARDLLLYHAGMAALPPESLREEYAKRLVGG